MIDTPQYQKRESIISYLNQFIGDPYEYGGDGKKGLGFDCSGLIQEGLWSIGALPFMLNGKKTDLNAQGLYEYFKGKAGKLSCPYGNLMFFGKDLKSIEHVALSVNEFQYIEAGGGDSRNIGGMIRKRPRWWRKDLVAEIDFLS